MARIFRNQENESQENQWQGDEITGPKDPDITRMQFHNVNGLSLFGHAGLDMFVNEQATLDIDHPNRY